MRAWVVLLLHIDRMNEAPNQKAMGSYSYPPTLERQSEDAAHSLVFLLLPSPSGLRMTNLSDRGFVKSRSVSF